MSAERMILAMEAGIDSDLDSTRVADALAGMLMTGMDTAEMQRRVDAAFEVLTNMKGTLNLQIADLGDRLGDIEKQSDRMNEIWRVLLSFEDDHIG